MKRLGAILIPMLAGFLLTVAVISWRTGSWPQRAPLESGGAAATRVESRRSNLRVVQVHLTSAPSMNAGAQPANSKRAAPTPAPPEAEAAPVAESFEPPPVPRVDPGNSPEQLEAPARKFSRGSKTDED